MNFQNSGTKGLNVLLVEDDRIIRSIITDDLTSRGMTVHIAANGREALSLFNENTYDLVLTDILMPEMSGLEMLRHIRRRFQELPVIIITSSRDVNHSIEALRLSATDYILKPIDLEELQARIALSFMKLEARKRERIQQFQLVEKVIAQEKKLEETFLQSVRSLINAIEARDRYTKGHSLRVTRLVDLMLRKLGIGSDLLSDVVLASQLHDTGKLGISDTILNKRSELSDDESVIMKTHPEVGYYILRPILPEECLQGILHHHERWDGEGYPMNLAGSSIPLGARIIALADSFDSMITDRTYRQALSVPRALQEIERCAGTQFDPELVPPFIEIISQHNPLEI